MSFNGKIVQRDTMPFSPLPSHVGKRGKSVMPPDREIVRYQIIDEISKFQDSSKSKVIVLQLVEFDNRKTEVRIGYYIIGKKPGKMRGRWVWGQYAAFMPLKVFQSLVSEARKRGWF